MVNLIQSLCFYCFSSIYFVLGMKLSSFESKSLLPSFFFIFGLWPSFFRKWYISNKGKQKTEAERLWHGEKELWFRNANPSFLILLYSFLPSTRVSYVIYGVFLCLSYLSIFSGSFIFHVVLSLCCGVYG